MPCFWTAAYANASPLTCCEYQTAWGLPFWNRMMLCSQLPTWSPNPNEGKIEDPAALIVRVKIEVKGVKHSIALINCDYCASRSAVCLVRSARRDAPEPRR